MVNRHNSIGLRIALLAGLMVLTACGQSQTSSAEYVQQAKEAREAGKLQLAVIALKNALEQSPDNGEARLLLGRLYLDVQQGEAAQKELERAKDLGVPEERVVVDLLRADLLQGRAEEIADTIAQEVIEGRDAVDTVPEGRRPEFLTIRGHALRSVDRLDGASRWYERALAAEPGFLEAQVGLAAIAFSRGQEDAARNRLEKVLNEAPTVAPAWRLLADIELGRTNLPEAIKALDKAIEHSVLPTEDHLKRALARVHTGDLEGAESDLSALEGLQFDHPSVHYARGVLAFEKSDLQTARAEFEKALSGDGRHPGALFYSGLVHSLQGNLEQAENALSRLVSFAPALAPAARLLAAVRLVRGDFEGAEQALTAVINRNPNDLDALGLLATAALRQGRPEMSVEYLQRRVALESDAPEVRTALGLSLLAANRPEEGTRELEAAVELAPETHSADVALVQQHLRRRDFDRALRAAEALAARKPDSAIAYNLIGLAKLGKGHRDDAKAAFRRAVDRDDQFWPAVQNLALMALQEEDFEAARRLYEGMTDHETASLVALIALAMLDARQGNSAAAIEHLEAAAEANPSAWEPKVMLSRQYRRSGDPQRALDALRGLDPTTSENPQVLMAFGNAQLAAGQAAIAARTFERLAELMPDSAEVRYRLASALAPLGDKDGIRRALDAALDLDPDALQAGIARARLALDERAFDEAETRLKALQQAHPESVDVTLLAAAIDEAHGRPARAAARYGEVLARTPENTEVFRRLVRAQWAAGEHRKALTALEERIEAHPDDVVSLVTLGDARLALSHEDAAIESFSRALELAPENVHALNNLAWLLRNREPQKALEFAERARSLAPNSAAVLDTLAMIRLERGEVDPSVSLLREAINRDARNLGYRYHLAMALALKGNEGEAMALLEELLAQPRNFGERAEAEALFNKLRSSQR